jgi:hypothetical protein
MAIVDVEASVSGEATLNADASIAVALSASLTPDASVTASASEVQVFWEVFDPKDSFTAKNPLPVLRNIKYRAQERAYSAILNDPNLLVLNSPRHRIGYPPMARQVAFSFITYDAATTPELDPVSPWLRVGSGSASIVGDTLVIDDASTGSFPTGQPIFWTRSVDLTFDHVFAMAWRFKLDSVPLSEGVFTGVAVGYSDPSHAVVIGFLDDGGVKKIGILRKGGGNDPSTLSAWTGSTTGTPVTFDWSTLHSYRIFRDKTGTAKVFVDGNVIEALKIDVADLPDLSELTGPFNQIQGTFFGSLSRPAENSSTWDFIRYQITPTNPYQTAPSSFVSYEATALPDDSTPPWNPVGFHGTSSVSSSELIIDSTSATTLTTEEDVGLIGGDFHGYVRLEPLLSVSSDVVLDVRTRLRTLTHGITPNAVMAAVDDGNRLVQLCFFPDAPSAKFSYGGRSLPGDSTPVPWSTMGTAAVTMAGRYLHISDDSTTDGRIYYVDDTAAYDSPVRVAGTVDYIYEFRVRVGSYTQDLGGFCGVAAEVFDGVKSIGVVFQEVAGTRYVTFASGGLQIPPPNISTPTAFAFDWFDDEFHTIRVVRSAGGGLVSLFINGAFTGSLGYSYFQPPVVMPSFGVYSFGSSTAASTEALSEVDWAYFNVWRAAPPVRKYVGIWKGYDPYQLTGYHLPLKAHGPRALIAGNVLEDFLANFVAAGVVPGDRLIIDVGPDKGVYMITSVLTSTALTVAPITGSGQSVGVSETVIVDDTLETAHFVSSTNRRHNEVKPAVDLGVAETVVVSNLPTPPVTTPFPLVPAEVGYRIPAQTDWAAYHQYRVVRDPGGGVSVFLDNDALPFIRVGYNEIDLPSSSVGILKVLGGGIPCIAFGSFDPTNLEQTAWDYVRYGITRSNSERETAPHHQILNQRNVISSPEHLTTSVPHTHTNFWSSSVGIPPQTEQDLLRNNAIPAYTQLNEGTPAMLLTQTSEIREPIAVIEPLSVPTTPEDVLLGSSGFVLNDSATRIKLLVPNDVLYNSLQLFEAATGENRLIAPMSDRLASLGSINFTRDVCLVYDGATLPEVSDSTWSIASDEPLNVTRSVASGVLSYGTNNGGTRTVYRNPTPLMDVNLRNEVSFRIKLANDGSNGGGDTQARFGFSAPGMTIALGLVTLATGDRYAILYDLNANTVIAGIPFDFLDGAYHVYKITRDPSAGTVDFSIDA